jgi:TonB-dependent SusC/RagA subfamily outer membrane receptor
MAQNLGTISGVVVDARTQQPLGSVQVSLRDTRWGTATGNDGTFRLPNVPAGTYYCQTRFIGYGVASVEAVVRGGQVTEVLIEIERQALQLDEIVVTGTAGAKRRREVGNTISQINVAEIGAPPASVDNLLQSGAGGAGLTVLKSSGMAGGGAQIRLRGNVSVSMSNQPLIYIDGVQIRNEAYPMNVPAAGNVSRSGNDVSSPLNDINPADIDRVEIIKGAAATTLYGAEAAAGVIQIFTKKGVEGPARWTLQVDQGFNRVLPFGADTAPYIHLDPWLRNAWTQKYSSSVSGGTRDAQYYVSGSYEDNQGVLPLDWEETVNMRANLDFSPVENLDLSWNVAYTNKDIQNTSAGNNSHGITLNVFRAERNYFGSNDPELINQLLEYEIFTYIDRFIGGGTATYSPLPWFTNRLTLGYDRANSEMRNYRPFEFVRAPQGVLGVNNFNNTTLSADYVGTIEFQMTGDLRSTFSFGGQSITRDEVTLSTYGEDFPGPGEPTVSSGAIRLGWEDRIRTVSAGLFVQNLFALKDRYFVTAGLRVDGNSVFGENLGLQAYPKFSVSYVLSDESFWNSQWGTVKLRAAWGQAGRAPGAFDKVRTWDPAGWGTSPAFLPNNVGNPDLGPERTTEIEVGADAAFFDDRIVTEFTYYKQRTTDALFSVRQIPSTGFQQSQLENVGELENKGFELNTTGSIFRGQDFTWDLGFSVYTNNSKVLDLGGVPEFSLGDRGWIVEGEPVPVIRAECVLNPDEIADPVTEEQCIYGPNYPTTTLGFQTSFSFGGGIRITGRGEYQGGHYIYDGAAYNALRRGVIWPACYQDYDLIDAGRGNELTAYKRAICITDNIGGNPGYLTYPADFFKLRELSATIPMPRSVFPERLRATLTLSARDAFRWKNKDFLTFDPEQMPDVGFDGRVRAILETVPPPATYTASFRIVF